MRYNLLQPIIDAINEGNTDRAEMLAWDLTNNLVGKPEGEKIWTNGECSNHSGCHSLRGMRQPKTTGISEHDQCVLVHFRDVPYHRE